MSSKKRTPILVKTGYLTVFTVVVWIVFEVVRIFMTKPKSDVPADILSPVDPKLDESVLSKISDRVYLDETLIKVNTSSSATPGATLNE
jgi:hypothetical protein